MSTKIIIVAIVIWYFWRQAKISAARAAGFEGPFGLFPGVLGSGVNAPSWTTTRPPVFTNAGTAPSQRSFGLRLHNVWDGPKQIVGGAPVLRRDQPA